MNRAQRFERRLERVVGTAFARVFKGQVEPVEIGAQLEREAGDKKAIMGAGQIMAPNRYRVTLSPSDHERLAPWADQLVLAFAELIQEHLDDQGWTTLGDIEVYLDLDETLHTGVFGVASRMESDVPPRRRPHDSLSLPVAPAYGAPAPVYGQPGSGDLVPGLDGGYSDGGYSGGGYADDGYPAQQPARVRHVLHVDGTPQLHVLHTGSNVVGRGQDADLRLNDQGVSRRHLDVQFDGYTATAYDLGSTNGTTINGRPMTAQQLQHGDVLRIGHCRLVFQQEPA